MFIPNTSTTLLLLQPPLLLLLPKPLSLLTPLPTPLPLAQHDNDGDSNGDGEDDDYFCYCMCHDGIAFEPVRESMMLFLLVSTIAIAVGIPLSSACIIRIILLLIIQSLGSLATSQCSYCAARSC